MDRNPWRGAAGWVVGVAIDLILLLASTPGVAFLGTLLLAAAWCIWIDREAYEVQLLGSDVPDVNR